MTARNPLAALFTLGLSTQVSASNINIVTFIFHGEAQNPRDGTDVTARGIEMCNGREFCNVYCDQGQFPGADPYPGGLKRCTIRYTCGNGPTLDRVLAEGKPGPNPEVLDCRGK